MSPASLTGFIGFPYPSTFKEATGQLRITLQATEVVSIMEEEKKWYWKCRKCGKVHESSEHRDVPTESSDCNEKQGGCGRVSSFVNVTEDVLREKLKK